ncbi:hypothetical protein IKG31_01435 [Candidatus Saccharibacteria bacterium]|nr:hypothetical protein [Candidatus Saccharibacteria bacterium]
MKPRLKTFLLSILCLGLIFGSLFIFKKAPSVASYSYYETLKISQDSFNSNSIWGGGETLDSVIVSGGLDGRLALYSSTNHTPGGLDPSGALSLNGVPYQLSWTGANDYVGNDTINLHSGHESAVINLDTVGAYEKLYILGTASGPSESDYANMTIVVHYTDETSDEVNYQLYDLRDSTPIQGVYKWPGLVGRSIIEEQEYEGSTIDAPYLQSATINIDSKKLVSSIEVNLVGLNGESVSSGVYCGIYAITGMVNVATPNPVESVYSSNITETTADIQWQTVMGATSYRLDVASDPSFKNVLPDYNNLYTQNDLVTVTGLSGGTTYYARVRAENAEGQSASSSYISFITDPETIPPTISIVANPGLIQIQDNITVVGSDASGIKEIDESLDGGTTWTEYSNNDRTDRLITENGTYCYRAIDNYDNISEVACVTYANLDTTKPSILVNTNGYTEEEWTSAPVTLSIENLTTNVGQTKFYYSTDGANWLPYENTLIVNEETGTDGKTYYFKAVSQAGVESDVQTIIVRRDITAPDGEIASSNNGWNQFLNTITFGLFFNETVNFDITATDDLSGINRIEYLISSEAFESKETAIAADGWNEVSGPVSIDPEGDYILYFKLIDNAGNISVINTDGIVLDATKALIRGYIDASHTFSLEDGETYYLVRKLLVTDNRNLSSIKVNDHNITLQDNNIIDLSPNQTYTVIATDKAGNATSLTIRTGSLADLDLNLTNDTFRTNDRSDIAIARNELSKIKDSEGSYATEEEQQVISDLITSYDNLLEQISTIEAKLDDEANRWAATPDIDHVTSANYESIQTLLNDIQTTLDECSPHITIEETNILLIQKRELEDKLRRLTSVENNLETIDIVNHTNVNIIKTEDKAELEDLKNIAKALVDGNNLTIDERDDVNLELELIRELITKVDNALSAKNTPAINAISAIIPTGYTINDMDILVAAKTDLETAIEEYSNNYTDAEKQELNTKLIAIYSSIDDINNQIWEETRRTTFPTISVKANTREWIPMDIVGVSATDNYGIDRIEYSADGGQTWSRVTDYDSGTIEIIKNGTYIFRATNEFSNVATETVEYHNIDPTTPIVSVDTHGYSSGSWTNQPVVLSAENVASNNSPTSIYYRIVSTVDGENDWLPYTGNIIITEDTEFSQLEFKAISGAGIESTIERVIVRKDSVVPTGTISLEENSLNSFLNSITFGLFFNETRNYKMVATDDHSGINTIEYLISDSELNTDELVASTNWKTTDGVVPVDPNKTTNIYYRLVDHADNISIVTLSGIVFDLPGLSNVDISVTTGESNLLTLATATGSIDLLPDLNHATADDLAVINSIRDELANYLERHHDDTSGVVDDILADYNHTASTIAEIEENVSIIESSYATIEDINSVTSDSKERITAIITAITDVEENRGNHLTIIERQTFNTMLDDLYNKLSRIIEIQTEYEDIDTGVNSYDINTVTKDDLSDLATLKARISVLLGSANITDEEKNHLRELLTIIAELEDRIAEAEKALEEAKDHDHSGGINSDNVTPGDQTTLQDAANAYAEALGVFDSNLSLSDLFDINNRITIINSALDILDQVAEFEAMISRLPNPEDVDYDSRLLIKAAEGAYNALSEYGRSLVGPSLLARYRAVLDAYRAYLEGSPLLYAFETLDVVWWGVSTFAIVGIFIFIVRRTHRRYIETGDSDNF